MKRYLIALLCLLGATTAMAQQKNNTPYQKFSFTAYMEMSTNFSEKNPYRNFGASLIPTYSITRNWFVGIPITISGELYKNQQTGIKNNFGGDIRLGVTAGYDFYWDEDVFTVSGAVLSTPLMNQAPQSLYYELGVKWSPNYYVPFRPIVGIGVRYYQSLTNTFRDAVCCYACLGLRF